MKKIILLFILAIGMVVSMAANRTGTIKTGFTTLAVPMTFGASDTINTSETVTIIVTNLQKYMQHQTFTTALTSVSGSPSVTITAYGKVNSGDSWTQIGTPVTWTTTATATISSTAPLNYNYLKVAYVASGATQQTKITSFAIKTANVYDIGSASAFVIGDGTPTIQINSSDWDIGTTGNMTGFGTIAANGLITATGGATITGAAVNLNASSNFAVNIGTGSTASAVTIGGGSNTVAVNSTNYSVSTTGVGIGLKLGTPVLNTTGTETLTVAQSNKMIVSSKSDGATTVVLPDPGATTVGVVYYILQTVDQNITVSLTTPDGNSIVCDGVATSDAVTISTASHKIGAGMLVIGISATQWYVGGLNPESVLTPEAAD
jgi:hypothetical protein